ncbi:Dorsal-ventral patterning tolloid-like protein 1 [Bulinus truncatus]|nr:Dorsal-ventral patterning tolloid-like protein 1 [Bulinus truncatus]
MAVTIMLLGYITACVTLTTVYTELHNRSSSLILDPCKADAYLGDIALDAEDYLTIIQTLNHKRYKNINSKDQTDLKTKTANVKIKKIRQRRAATAIRERLWPYGVIPFQIDSIFSGHTRVLFKQAMRHWENYTCITFKEKEPEDEHFILFTRRPCGCCSFVGKKGSGGQAVSIGDNCDTFGIVVHELGHAIGFWHEHTRPDRDKYVQIITRNVIPGQEYNFNKLTSFDVNSLGEIYDYGSIMHYSKNTFAIDTKLDTLLPIAKPGTVRPEIGQRVRLSEIDIRQTIKLYACPSCGRTLQESKGHFAHTPKRGSRDICQWRISAAHGDKIFLNVTDLDIPTSFNCKNNYLEVRDGHHLKSQLLGRFCGAQLPDLLISSGPRLWIEYRTEFGDGKGFSASYEVRCGGEFKKDEGFISSPNYPDHYLPQRMCVWRITVAVDFTVALKFQTFETEKHENCQFDYLEIRDGPSGSSPLIGNFCGNKIPGDIKSSGYQMYIKFVSDVSVQKSGFSAMFEKEHDECSNDDHGCDHECVNTLGSYTCACRTGYELHSDGKRCEDICGGYLDTENGIISSPSFPDLYPSNKNCIWKIVAPNGYKIYINFTHFDLEGPQPSCQSDSLRISSPGTTGDGENLKVVGVFCGDKFPAPYISENNSLRIEFNSDNSVQKTGFTAQFITDKDECSINNGGCEHICKNVLGSYKCNCLSGFSLNDDLHSCKEAGCHHELTNHSGVITSPNYPEYYPSRNECVWHFVTAPGHRIKLQFRTFELEPDPKCTYDYVALFDGNSSDASNIARLCGPSLPNLVTSTYNYLFMAFSSDASVQRKGFKADYFSVCGSNLEASVIPQSIWSHAQFGKNNYDINQNCEWKVHSKAGQQILLIFNILDIEDDIACSYDNVTVYDGFLEKSPLLGKYCGTETPNPVISSFENLLIRFQSDNAVSWKGFSATYQLADKSSKAENKS